MPLLTIVLATFFFLLLARTLGRRRGESPNVVVPGYAWGETKASASSQHRRHDSSSQQVLGKVLAYVAKVCAAPFDSGELFFVKMGLSPYWHTCIDDFIPMLCPACEWSSRHHDLIVWRGEALVELADWLKVQGSAQLLLDSDPSNKLTGSSAFSSSMRELCSTRQSMGSRLRRKRK